ncbi:LysR family transcriptional regulator [Paenibacillus sp. P46E]|uniref:LysR family transcriptional regulator n=1 Tax=Paenibacillus sp. P46E TaxID=1349436 RepID=UPI00093AE7C0|nr:LysR family transcriptional regulator [Paenibacillus sp. P46E]OKP99035.1 hypothetical protein A3849_07600 [Paenibacillus sp. P46E]
MTTVSQQIASLEDEFNIQLIDSKQIPIEPTGAGWLFYREAIVLRKQYNHMRTSMENYHKYNTQLDKVLLKDVAAYLQKGIYDVAIDFDSVSLREKKISG